MSKNIKKVDKSQTKLSQNDNDMTDDENHKTSPVHSDNDEDDSGSEIEAEMELIYEDDTLRQEYEDAKQWLESLQPKDLLKKDLFVPETIAELRKSFMDAKPYHHLVIQDFIDKEFLEKVYEELQTLEYKPKNNDLYLFHQTALDIKSVKRPLLQKLCSVLYSPEFVTLLREITDLPLFGIKTTQQETSDIKDNAITSNIDTTYNNHEEYSEPDMFGAVYSDTCRLLCHDDELEGRRIAYILYFAQDWTESDGGHLDLFNATLLPSKNGSGPGSYVPTTLGQSYCPKFGQFAFFEVGEESFHQVREVYAKEKQRVSISGWYHGHRIHRKHDEYVPSPPLQFPPQQPNSSLITPYVHTPYNVSNLFQETREFLDEELREKVISQTHYSKLAYKMAKPDIVKEIKYWINTQYLEKKTQKQTQEHFGDESSIDLQNILKPEIYIKLLQECYEIETLALQKQLEEIKDKPTYPTCAIQPDESSDSPIELIGPCNQRCYYRVIPQNVLQYIQKYRPSIESSLIIRFLQFLQSPAFYTLVHLLTDLELTTSYTELQMWRNGTYSLAHDNNPETHLEGVDIFFTLYSSYDELHELFSLQNEQGKELNLKESTALTQKINKLWSKDDFGGDIFYLAAGEDEELLSLMPMSNTLSIVYRSGGDGVLQFQRYLNHHAPGSMYRFAMLARVPLDEEEEEEAPPPPPKKKKTKSAAVAAATAAAKKTSAKK